MCIEGMVMPMVVLPPALICPLVPKHCHPFIASSSAFTFHCFIALFNLSPPLISSLPLPLSSYWPFFIFISALFISSSVLLFHASSLFLSLCVLSRHLSLSVHLHLLLFFFFFKTPTHSLCSRSPHFLSHSDVSREGTCLVAEVECLMHVFH